VNGRMNGRMHSKAGQKLGAHDEPVHVVLGDDGDAEGAPCQGGRITPLSISAHSTAFLIGRIYYSRLLLFGGALTRFTTSQILGGANGYIA